VILVIACELLGFGCTVLDLKCDEVGDQVDEVLGREYAPDQHFKFRAARVVVVGAADGAPRCETVQPCRHGAKTGV
jgi:hypothetical protein